MIKEIKKYAGFIGLFFIVAFAIALVEPGRIFAAEAGSNFIFGTPSYSTSYPYNPYYYGTPNYYYVQPPAPTPLPAPVDYSNAPTIYSANGENRASSANNTVTSTTNRNANSSKSTVEVKTAPVVETKTDANLSDLSATALFGSNSFLPSGIIGWILLAILILLIVILIRKILGSSENYHASPLKHS